MSQVRCRDRYRVWGGRSYVCLVFISVMIGVSGWACISDIIIIYISPLGYQGNTSEGVEHASY